MRIKLEYFRPNFANLFLLLLALVLILSPPAASQQLADDEVGYIMLTWWEDSCGTFDKFEIYYQGHLIADAPGREFMIMLPDTPSSLIAPKDPNFVMPEDPTAYPQSFWDSVAVDSIAYSIGCQRGTTIDTLPDGSKLKMDTQYIFDIHGLIGTPTLRTVYSDTFKYVPGDIDGNGVIDGVDLIMFGPHFGKTGVDYYNRADMNKDGRVDGQDYIILGRYFGRTNSQNPRNYFEPME